MAIPDYQSIMLPFLMLVADGNEHKISELNDRLVDHFELTEDERKALLPSGNQEVMRNRVGWARTYLKKSLLIQSPRRGVFVITDRGKSVLAGKPERIDVKFLRQFEEFLEFQNASKKPSEQSAETTASDQTPIESIEQAHDELKNELASEVLDTVKQASPQFFEHLVVKLLQAMGYGGWSTESGSATQYSADGGIDGVINEDPLGLETIYLQAKRYSEGTIGRPAVQSFAGALDMKRAKKGVFITTSKFSSDAIAFVEMIEKKIVLIDGERLARLMVANNLGVSVRDTYQLKVLDSDFFDEE